MGWIGDAWASEADEKWKNVFAEGQTGSYDDTFDFNVACVSVTRKKLLRHGVVATHPIGIRGVAGANPAGNNQHE